MQNKTKQLDLPMDIYQQLLEYAEANQLKAPSASQGTKVIAAIEKLSQTLSNSEKAAQHDQQ